MSIVVFSDLHRAKVLAVLHNHARSMFTGLAVCDATASDDLTLEEARSHIARRLYFDYLDGRALFVDLSGDQFDSEFYDQLNGEGMAQKAIDRLRETGSIMPWQPERPLEPSAGLSHQSAEAIIDSAADRIAQAMKSTREAYERGQLG